MQEMGRDIADHFKDQGVTKVMTIESSGISPALFVACELGVPLLILKKQSSAILKTDVIQTEVVSFTKEHQLSADSGTQISVRYRPCTSCG